jgi:CBS domain-containing protein
MHTTIAEGAARATIQGVVDRVRLSSLQGRPLRANVASDAEIGRVVDATVRLVEVGHPPLTGLLVDRDGEVSFVPAKHLGALGPDSVELAASVDVLGPFERRAGEILLARDLVDHKLICVRSRLRPQLVRAEDVVLVRDPVARGWHLFGVDVAEGAERLRRRLRHRLHLPGRDDVDEHTPTLVPWRELEPFVGHVPTARRRLGIRTLRRMHPARIADLLEEASVEEGREILGALEADPELEADVIEELDSSHRLGAVRDRSNEEVAELLGAMAPDDAADLLASLDQERRAAVLALMPGPQQGVVRSLLGYHPDTAGGLMTPNVVCMPESASVEETCRALHDAEDLPDNLGGVFVLDADGRLIGFVPLVKLVGAPPGARIGGLAQPDPPRVGPNADLVEIAVTTADYNLAALPVVDTEDRVIGAVTVDDVLPRVLPAGWRRRMEAIREA